MSLQKPFHTLIVGLLALVTTVSVQAAQDFASPLFAAHWQQDEQVAPNFWGPLANARPGQEEPYHGADVCRPPRQCIAAFPDGAGTGRRLVQYFDKGRMEVRRDNSQGAIVTAGLLVRELITGQMQVGDTDFQTHTPAAIPVAGDSTNMFPLYRDLASGPVVSGAVPVGSPAMLLSPQGSSAITQPQDAQTLISLIDTQTSHSLPKVFADFRRRVGLANIGLALTEPFWADIQVAGTTRRVLIQAFERRVLTYNPANPAPSQVEFGNVGQQYYVWRYGTMSSTAPPATDPAFSPIIPQPPGGTRVLTLADDGQTIVLFPGTSLLLSLGNDLDWRVQVGDEAILRFDPNAAGLSESQGMYVAGQPGRTTLTATGDPKCASAIPRCLAPSRAFRVEIVVKQVPLPAPETA